MFIQGVGGVAGLEADICVCVCVCMRQRPADRFATQHLFATQISEAAVPGIWKAARTSPSTFLEALLHQRCSQILSLACTLAHIRGLQMLRSLPECLLRLVVLFP